MLIDLLLQRGCNFEACAFDVPLIVRTCTYGGTDATRRDAFLFAFITQAKSFAHRQSQRAEAQKHHLKEQKRAERPRLDRCNLLIRNRQGRERVFTSEFFGRLLAVGAQDMLVLLSRKSQRYRQRSYVARYF